jgi:hypothetical protein
MEARAALLQQQPNEPDEQVQNEIRAALSHRPNAL